MFNDILVLRKSWLLCNFTGMPLHVHIFLIIAPVKGCVWFIVLGHFNFTGEKYKWFPQNAQHSCGWWIIVCVWFSMFVFIFLSRKKEIIYSDVTDISKPPLLKNLIYEFVALSGIYQVKQKRGIYNKGCCSSNAKNLTKLSSITTTTTLL